MPAPLPDCRWFLKAGLTAAVVFAVQQPDLPPFARSCLYVLGGFLAAAAQLPNCPQQACRLVLLGPQHACMGGVLRGCSRTGFQLSSMPYRRAAGLYTMLGLVMDGPAALVLRPLRLRLAPHFLPPWESRSLAAFW